MQSSTHQVPDRFLAYAFGAGDLFIELDAALCVAFVDGAEALIDPDKAGIAIGTPLKSLLSPEGWAELSIIETMNTRASFRFGPVAVPVGVSANKRRRFLVFVNKVLGRKRLFITLSLESRLVPQAPTLKAAEDLKAQTAGFVDRVEKLITENSGEPDSPKMTIVEADVGALPQSAGLAVVKGLAKHSVDGMTATQINDGQFAVLHAGGNAAPSSEDIVQDVARMAGIALRGKSIAARGDKPDQSAVFLHTLKEVLTAPDAVSLDEICGSYEERLQANMGRADTFRQLIDQGNFDLLFQPIVHLSSRKVHHLEALTRFRAGSGFSNPFETIKFAEDIGLVPRFDLAVVSRVLETIISQRARKAPTKIAANVSGCSLNQPDFCDALITLLQNSLVREGDLQIEITESFQVEDLHALSDVVKDIQSLGSDVYLDDFGAGASGFQYLRVLPVKGVKIDGPYIRDALRDPQAKAFLRAMIGLCKDLGIKTVAEWIETEDQHSLLRDLGTDFGQGYLYGAGSKLETG